MALRRQRCLAYGWQMSSRCLLGHQAQASSSCAANAWQCRELVLTTQHAPVNSAANHALPSWGAASGWASWRHVQQQAGERQPKQQQQQQQERECWSCKHHFKKGGLVCSGCEKIQPLDKSLDYFQLLGMPMQYNINVAKLEQQYKLLQWRVHPDRLTKHTTQEQQYSADLASHVNMAYSVLRNPLSRANYMLALRGLATDDDSEATLDDPEYLEEVIEAREAVEESEDEQTLKQLLSTNRAQQHQVVERLGKAFASPSGSSEALDLTTRLTYLAKLEAAIVAKLPTHAEFSA